MKLRYLTLAVVSMVLALAITACAQMGMQPLTTFNERMAAAYTTVQTIAEGTKAAFVAKKITSADRDNVVASERTALDALKVADELHSTNPQAGENKLTATLAVLSALNVYVTTQGAKP